MAPSQKVPEVKQFDADGYEDSYELYNTYKTNEADKRDMMRMNKPQEMRVCQNLSLCATSTQLRDSY